MTERKDNGPRTLKTLETTSRIIEALKGSHGSMITELAEELDLSKGAVYNHLATLCQEKFVVKEGDQYRLSYKFLQLGEHVKHNSILYNVGKPSVDNLVEQTGETGNLMIEQYGRGVYLYKKKGKEGIADEFHANLLGGSDYLHHSATGKAILAELPEERVEAIIDEYGLPRSTEHTITTRSELYEELETIRETGYALNDEEQVTGTRAISVAITSPENDVLGAVGISGPMSRMSDNKIYDDFPEAVLQTANIIEISIKTKGQVPVQL